MSPDSLGTIAAVQHEFSQQSAQASADALLDSFDAGTHQGRRARACLLSCACRPASAWLDKTPSPRPSSSRVGKSALSSATTSALALCPPPPPPVQCNCSASLRHADTDHWMRCPLSAAHTTLRHDILRGILRRVVHRAGIASTLDPSPRRLPGLVEGPGISATSASTRVGAQGDILLALPGSITIADFSVIHPLSISIHPVAATTAGAAAAQRG
jgi:hypothetical protein